MNTKKKRATLKKKDSDLASRRFTFQEFAEEFYPKEKKEQPKLDPFEEGVELAKRLVTFAPSH
ncbi:MAG TPA: hypothetical protein VFD13_07175 [Candidatus Kapabacteria bacterium]|nr:hypothetical protein [Candidatus Kapabacteria bacterium]